MTELETWLKHATRHLSRDSAAQVRTEISGHFESAREAALNCGTAAAEADRSAVTALGSAKAANREYRRVLLTSAEARLLRNGNCEARAVCSRPWLKSLLLAIPVTALLAAIAFFLAGELDKARTLFMGSIGIGLFVVVPFLPVYTPSRGRVFRILKWVAMLGIFGLAFGPSALEWSWLLLSCLWPIAWIEWTRMSIRRKLPISQWPKQLYL